MTVWWILGAFLAGVAAVLVFIGCAVTTRRAQDRELLEHLASRNNAQSEEERRLALRRIWKDVGGPLQ